MFGDEPSEIQCNSCEKKIQPIRWWSPVTYHSSHVQDILRDLKVGEVFLESVGMNDLAS